MTIIALLMACACLMAQWRVGGAKGLWLLIGPCLTLLLDVRSGMFAAILAAISVRLFEEMLRQLALRRRLERLRDASEEPIQAMFEQASLFGSAELCALASLPACGPVLRPIWQRALALWLRGSASEEAFREIGRREGLPLLVQLGRALSLSRRSGTPLARHLAVLLEDAAEDRRRRREAQGQSFPYFAVTAALAAIVLLGAIGVLATNAGLDTYVAVAVLVSAGLVPLATVRLLP